MERPIISFDYAIKDILRDKANFDILSGFLTELLEKHVTVQKVLESEGNTTIQNSQLQTAELKSEKRGLERGEAIGLEKEKEKAAIRSHKNGHSIDTIAEFTELSTEQIINILKEMRMT